MTRTLPHPSHPDAPKYWQHETGGQLVPAVLRYMRHQELSLRDVALIRAYLRQWVEAPAWEANPGMTHRGMIDLVKLRAKVLGAKTKDQIDECIAKAVEMGMDPL